MKLYSWKLGDVRYKKNICDKLKCNGKWLETAIEASYLRGGGGGGGGGPNWRMQIYMEMCFFLETKPRIHFKLWGYFFYRYLWTKETIS